MGESIRKADGIARLCRVLANRTRLKMLALVWRDPGQTLSVLARRANVSVATGSQYVRTLESQGLLTTRQRVRWLECRPASTQNGEAIHGLVLALRARVEDEKKAAEVVFKLATAFTHVRRVEIYRALQTGQCTLAQLRRATGISRRPLLRHLAKLRSRNFVRVAGKRRKAYSALRHADAFGHALAELTLTEN